MSSRAVSPTSECRARRGLACALLLAATFGLATELEPMPPLTRAVDCSRAVQVGTRLRCGEDRPGRVLDACQSAGLPGLGSGEWLHAGDHVDPWMSCVHGRPRGRMAPTAIGVLGLPVNVNEASAQELASLPGIGPELAARVIQGRPFAALDDLVRVRGIGPVRMAGLGGRAVVAWDR